MSLITVEALASRLDEPLLRICDVRWYLADPDRGRREYAAGHVPGALFVDLDTVLTTPNGPGRHPLPPPAEFTRSLGALGIGPEHHVVAYDSSGGGIAARLWWMLRTIGHTGVEVLDGGLPAWTAAGLPTSATIPDLPAVAYPSPPVPDRWPGTVGRDELRKRLGRALLLDARAADRFRGDEERVDARPGHVPTAHSAPYEENLGPDGRFRPPTDLRGRYEDLGVVDAPDVVVYCGSGVTACHDLLAMAVAGLHGAMLYPGSWSDWSAHAELPAVTGPEPGTAPAPG